MKFSLKQLFSIVDGRLSTSIDDVYAILDCASGSSLMTHHLPTARKFFVNERPGWYVEAEEKINSLKGRIGDDFNRLMDEMDDVDIEVTEYPDQEKFGEYMVENSPLKNL